MVAFSECRWLSMVLMSVTVVEWSEQLRSVTSVWLGATAAAFKSDSAPAGVWAKKMFGIIIIIIIIYYYFYLLLLLLLLIKERFAVHCTSLLQSGRGDYHSVWRITTWSWCCLATRPGSQQHTRPEHCHLPSLDTPKVRRDCWLMLKVVSILNLHFLTEQSSHSDR